MEHLELKKRKLPGLASGRARILRSGSRPAYWMLLASLVWVATSAATHMGFAAAATRSGTIIGNWTSPNVLSSQTDVRYSFSGTVGGEPFQFSSVAPGEDNEPGSWRSSAKYAKQGYRLTGTQNDGGLVYITDGGPVQKNGEILGRKVLGIIEMTGGNAMQSDWQFVGLFDGHTVSGSFTVTYRNGSIAKGTVSGNYRIS